MSMQMRICLEPWCKQTDCSKFYTIYGIWCHEFKCAYWYLGVSMSNNVMRCVAMLHNSLQVDLTVHIRHSTLVCSRISSSCILRCKHMILAVSMLGNIFPLHTETLNYSILVCNVNVNINNFLLMLTSIIIQGPLDTYAPFPPDFS